MPSILGVVDPNHRNHQTSSDCKCKVGPKPVTNGERTMHFWAVIALQTQFCLAVYRGQISPHLLPLKFQFHGVNNYVSTGRGPHFTPWIYLNSRTLTVKVATLPVMVMVSPACPPWRGRGREDHLPSHCWWLKSGIHQLRLVVC